MPKERRIRIRGKQRNNIDLDLLVQALLMLNEERLQAEQATEESPTASSEAASSNREADA